MDQTPTQYALLDVDGDGITELILSTDVDAIGFSTFEVLAYSAETDSIQPVMFQDFTDTYPYATCHNGLRYSEKYHALVYKRMNNGSMFGSFDFHVIQGGQESAQFSLGYDTMAGSGEKTYTYSGGGGSENISEEQFQAYLNEAAFVEFQPFTYE